jgi:hypothetical protein
LFWKPVFKIIKAPLRGPFKLCLWVVVLFVGAVGAACVATVTSGEEKFSREWAKSRAAGDDVYIFDIVVNGGQVRPAWTRFHPFWGVGVCEVVDDVLAAVFVGACSCASAEGVGHGVGVSVLGHWFSPVGLIK